MFRPAKYMSVLCVSVIALSPLAPSLDFLGAGPAYAEKGGNGGGNGKGGGNGNGGGNGASKSGAESGGKTAKRTKAEKVANGPSSLGKMNGAMHANINAVLAHIRNGQTSRGPVGLFAGVAAADSVLATATAAETALLEAAAAYDKLEKAIADSGIEGVTDVESYLSQYDPDDLATQNAEVDDAIAALGGDAAAGTGPTVNEPTEAELASAGAAVEDAAAEVTDAETALLDAANKENMDGEALLGSLRDRLVGHEDAVAAAVAGG